MFNIGDLVIYSTHGICKIDDICEKTVLGTTRPYYVLRPIEDNYHLKISAPVHSDKVLMLELIKEEEANEVIVSFKSPGIKWIDNPNKRHNVYSDIVNTGNRLEVAKVVNTLIRKKIEVERLDRKFHERDRKFLNNIQNILFEELAICLNTSLEYINELVNKKIKGQIVN